MGSEADAMGTPRLVPGGCGWGCARVAELAPRSQPVPVRAQAERRLQALEGKESRTQQRLQELGQSITALQEQGQDTRRMAQRAKDGAQRATATAGMLSQVRPSPAMEYGVTVGAQPHRACVPPGPGASNAALHGAENSGERAGRSARQRPAACDTADG